LRGQRSALGHVGDPVAVARGLAGEEQPAAGAQDALELAEAPIEVGQVVKDGVPEDEIEALVVEGQLLGVAGDGLDVEVQAPRVGLQRVEHAGGDVGGHGVGDHARLEHVEAEVAGAGADLQRAPERLQPAQRLAHLAQHLLAPDLAVVNAPLGVVAGGRAVVVGGVDGADLVGGGAGRSRHRRWSVRSRS
jgi:hypothetical protein